jgi:DNA-binding transcriptional LysR family regulator
VDVGGVLEQRLDDGELDFAVIAGRSSRSSLLSRPVGAAQFAWTVAPGLAGAGRLGAAALLQRHPLVTLPPQAGTTRLLDDWLLAQGASVRERILCNSWGAVASMLRAGLGVGFLPPAGSPPWACAPSGAPIPRPPSLPCTTPSNGGAATPAP